MIPLRRSYIPFICTFIIGVVVSLTLFVIVKNWEQTDQRIEFESRSRGYANAVQGNLNKYLGALNFLGDFFNNSRQVTRQEFTVFAESVLSRYPGIQAFSWNPLVMGNERAVYESLTRKEGLKTFKFTEKTEEGALVDAAQRQEYVVVYYIVPLETNKPALGYNIASDTTRLQSIDQAFKTGELTATARITLVQETGNQFGVLVFFPLYQQGVSLKTSEARLKYRKGLVVEVLRLGDVVEAAFKDFPDEGINLYLYDASAKKGNRLLYARPSRMSGMTEQPMDEEVIQKDMHWSNNFEIAGRQWKILFSPSPFFLDSKHSWQSWLMLFVSLLLTATLLLYLLKRLNYTTEIEWQVREQFRTNQALANEITERRRTEEALRESEARLRDITFSMADWVWEVDENGVYTYSSQKGSDILGRSRAKIIGKTPFDFMPPDEARRVAAIFSEIVANKAPIKDLENWNIGKGGEKICLLTNGVPILDEEGNLKGYRGVDKDITERKQAEEKIQASLLEKETMLKEIHHRVKNNLQVISSLLDLQSSYLQDEKVKEMFQNSVGRISAMANIHSMLYRSEGLASVDFGDFIRDLAGRLQQSYLTSESPTEVHVNVADVSLPIETSIPCGLILNELISNALKHAFPEGRGGEVTISMKTAGDRFVLKVQDRGIGFPEAVDFQNPQTLGLELVNLLVGQINGKIDMRVEGGTTWTITFPVKSKREWQNG